MHMYTFIYTHTQHNRNPNEKTKGIPQLYQNRLTDVINTQTYLSMQYLICAKKEKKGEKSDYLQSGKCRHLFTA